ncbi:YbaB/EbfC family nucleoid-associated protein [Streptosporangium sp. NPDC051023]|uniref:YbaB/EbfC family nucleoid-associated protein n=1 Tax=Streptosporangium sp. NPDC051023 TaxID=3155410 RepID=UPI0034508148
MAVSDESDARGTGEAAGGLVSAEVGADGLLERLRLNPRSLRLCLEELAEEVVSAVRAAQQDRIGRIGERPEEAVAPADLGPEVLMRRLDEMEIHVVHDFDRLTATLDETLRRLEDR